MAASPQAAADLGPGTGVLEISSRRRCFELALVCSIAFAPAVLNSTFITMTGRAPIPQNLDFRISAAIVQEVLSVVLVLYLLRLRRANWSYLGLNWHWSDPVIGLGLLIFARVLGAFFWTILHTAPGWSWRQNDVRAILLGNSAVPALAWLFAAINPFFEELIVRAFVMSEIIALTRRPGLALLASVLLQASYHTYQGLANVLQLTIAFTIFAAYFAQRRRILPVIFAHMYMDYLFFFVARYR